MSEQRSEAATDQGWRQPEPFNLKAMLEATKRKVDEAREQRLSRTKDEWVEMSDPFKNRHKGASA